MSNKFEILMHQLDMPLEMRNSEAFLNVIEIGRASCRERV